MEKGRMHKQTKNLILFFAATFLWTWACYAPMAISGNSPYQMPWMILLILGGAGPSIVGVVMALLTYDKEQRRDYWQRSFSFRRIDWKMWLAIFLVFPAIYGLSILLDLSMGGALPGMEQLKSLIAYPTMLPLVAFISFMSGPWSEEFGWRGYALSPMLNRFGALRGSIVLGVLWGVWHLPLYFMPATWHGQMGFKFAGFWIFILENVAVSLIMTWVFSNTNRSILSGMLVHFASNFTGQLLAPSSDRVEIVRTILMLIVGVAACMLIKQGTRNVADEFGRHTRTLPISFI
jgi:uncharacterized protein